MISTTVIRHPREKLSKCSLTPLHGRPEMNFLMWAEGFQFDATGYTLLSVGAPQLSTVDAQRPLLILDSTWKLLKTLEGSLLGEPVRRSIPLDVVTAYPRVSKDGSDPAGGLASVEALYVARRMLGDPDESLLADYHWASAFLSQFQN